MTNSKFLVKEVLLIGLTVLALGCSSKQKNTSDSSPPLASTSSSVETTALTVPPAEEAPTVRREPTSRSFAAARVATPQDRMPASVEDESTTTFNRTTFMDPVPTDEAVASHGMNYIWLILIAIVVLLAFAMVRRVRNYQKPVK